MRKFILGLIAAAFVTVVLSGCRSIRYVAVPEYHYETITKTDTFTQKDSIFCHDSVFVFKNGDTITISKIKYVYKDRWRDRVRTDSILKVDSVRVPYPVEKQLTKWRYSLWWCACAYCIVYWVDYIEKEASFIVLE